ncbi:competence protein ComEC [Amycolatopsis arida]|uniref:Competence protein ComEC n=1 Tax=Amycolatopsis arida TaxID=587909 RepID=A0A1I5UTS8_9PSEU|nr:ComEC/Rec2 family competence protein [Amycolatopsis arida]TDX91031.1 competence protein ComEC [Amycolatopsis arida]SFP98661.1 competence protein ComEC [Amycolatopsis arida]
MSTPPVDPPPRDPPPRVRHDVRLVPAALVVWGAVLLGCLHTWWLTVATAGTAALAAVPLLRHGRPALRRAAAAVLAGGVLAAVTCGLRLARAEQDPLRTHADRGAHAVLRVVVTERPRPVRAAGFAGRPGGTRLVVLRGQVRAATVTGQPVPTGGRVVLVAAAEEWSHLLPGQEVTATGRMVPARPGQLTAAVCHVRGPPADATPAPWWERAAASMRADLRSSASVMADEPAGLLPGLVVGDTDALSLRVEDEFRDAGLTHLLAVSGSNVAIVCGAVLMLLRLLRIGPRVRAAAAGLVLAGFVILVGPEPSVLRAGVMGAVALLALALGRNRSAVPALAVAIGGVVLYDPAMATSVGFALSVVATAGLVLLAPRWADGRGVPTGAAEALAIPVAAFLATAPVLAGVAGELSVVSVVANLLAAPVVAPVTVLGVAAVVLAGPWPGAAEVPLRVAEPGVEWLILVAREASAVPGATLNWPGGWWGGALAALVAALLVLALRHRAARTGLAVVLVVGLLVFVPLRTIAPPWPPAGWSVVACDVGQGDAIVLATGEPGRAVVVDTGPQPGPVDRCLDRLDVRRVPLIVLSHLHADHIGGLASVFEGRAVGGVAVGPGRSPHWAWRQVADQAAAHDVPLLELAADDRLAWPDLRLEVIGPRHVTGRSADQDGTAINNTSLVARAATAAGSVLLTGDIELIAQGDLLAAGVDLRADVLKVPHHGSRFSLPGFLAAVAPRLAVVSVGAGNTYGHPHPTTLGALTAGGALVVRTDTDGDTAVLPDTTGPAVVRRGRGRAGGRSRGPPEPCGR